MAKDTRQAFKAALKAVIQTVKGIACVSFEDKLVKDFTTDEYPLVRVNELDSSFGHYITSAEVNVIRFEILIAVKPDVSDDVLSGYAESIQDLIYQNPQISNTCDYCLAESQFTPEEWNEDGYKTRQLYYRVMLRRSK